jgi:hypothetical protein
MTIEAQWRAQREVSLTERAAQRRSEGVAGVAGVAQQPTEGRIRTGITTSR